MPPCNLRRKIHITELFFCVCYVCVYLCSYMIFIPYIQITLQRGDLSELGITQGTLNKPSFHWRDLKCGLALAFCSFIGIRN